MELLQVLGSPLESYCLYFAFSHVLSEGTIIVVFRIASAFSVGLLEPVIYLGHCKIGLILCSLTKIMVAVL